MCHLSFSPKVDLLEASITRECVVLPTFPLRSPSLIDCAIDRCADLRQQIQTLQDGEYTVAKRDVDRLRAELGQPALPPLQTKLDEKTSQ